MNILELKALIADLPDDTPVLVAGQDHEYDEVYHIIAGNVWKRRGFLNRAHWTEDFGEDSTPDAQRTQALLIGCP